MGLTEILSSPGHHRCPRHGCQAQVPDARYACPMDWAALSSATKQAIMRTRHRHVLDPERRAAFRMADIDWKQ
jgi:hypothetical protein